MKRNQNLHYFAEKYAKFYSFVLYRCKDQDAAKDLLHQSLIRIREKASQFNSQRGTLFSWIEQIIKNEVIGHYRKETRRKSVQLDDSIEIEETIHDPIDQLPRITTAYQNTDTSDITAWRRYLSTKSTRNATAIVELIFSPLNWTHKDKANLLMIERNAYYKRRKKICSRVKDTSRIHEVNS